MVLLSNDTDVLSTVLHYIEYFTSILFNELWMQFGTGKGKGFIPEHKLLTQLGPQLYSNFIKCHVLTGTDSTSKVGTKFSALKSDLNKYLQNSGSNDCTERQFQHAEEYLIKVLQKDSASSNFGSQRYEQYMKKVSLIEFPPTSNTINGHLERPYYVANTCVNLLNGKK